MSSLKLLALICFSSILIKPCSLVLPFNLVPFTVNSTFLTPPFLSTFLMYKSNLPVMSLLGISKTISFVVKSAVIFTLTFLPSIVFACFSTVILFPLSDFVTFSFESPNDIFFRIYLVLSLFSAVVTFTVSSSDKQIYCAFFNWISLIT